MKMSATAQTPAAAIVALVSQLPATTTFADHDKSRHFRQDIEHVLLISIDGFHAVDLSTCIASNLCPHLAGLAQHGTTYANAFTTKPHPTGRRCRLSSNGGGFCPSCFPASSWGSNGEAYRGS